ncbi:uncharacterized protein LOC120845883 [Ixodes scapularis]|uniref:uncharacterized protein LOC120845883 n=1 Tax=Ixodes scapularis TaxID=6945 RepID=UPI001A9EEABB|nr:uncharacterized protein LOC120845883 [Ixodes scapularis]
MFALFSLVISFLCQNHAISSKKDDGDLPDAKQVIQKLPQTFMRQSLGDYPKLICGYQRFYNETDRKYDLIFKYPNELISLPLYVKNVTENKIYMGTTPEPLIEPEYELDILFSNMKSCMVTRNPDADSPRDCNLMVTKDHFDKPLKRCLKKFIKHCNGQAFNYTIKDCPYPETKN